MKIFQALARPFVSFVERYYPDAFIFVIVLSLITFLSALFLTDSTFSSTLMAWGDGLPMLLKFTAQITIIMMMIFRFIMMKLGRYHTIGVAG